MKARDDGDPPVVKPGQPPSKPTLPVTDKLFRYGCVLPLIGLLGCAVWAAIQVVWNSDSFTSRPASTAPSSSTSPPTTAHRPAIEPSESVETQEATGPLSEAAKKQIFWEGFSLEHKATREANAKYPIPDPTKPGYSSEAVGKQFRANAEYSAKLIKQYDAQLLRKYGITKQQYNSIIEEGLMRKWPKPVFKQSSPPARLL